MENWISTNQQSGTSGTNLVTAVATSNSGLKRSTELTVTATKWGITKTAKVKINQASIYSGISMTNIVPDSSGGTYQVTVMSEGPFAVSASDPTWIILSPTTGTGGTQVITVVITANETGSDRTGGITATTLDGRYTDDISFTQENMPISGISISSIQPEDTGGTYVITVTSETQYTISASDPTWIILSPTSGGSGITTISVVIPENNTGSGRTGGITATTTDNQYSDSISFTQQSVYVPTGVTINGSVNPADTGGSYTITIESDLPFTVSASDSTWITVSPSSGGSGTTTVTVTITGNDTGTGRTGSITAMTTDNQYTDVITFTQAAINPPHDYSSDYFTTRSLVNGNTISFNITANTSYATSISYSTDNGTTWNTTNVTSSSQTISVSGLSSGDTVLWKGIAYAWHTSRFGSTGNFEIEGNIMSLFYGDNFSGQTSYPSSIVYEIFRNLFNNNNYLISAGNLILPATALKKYIYRSMFANCTSLVNAPSVLPAISLQEECYGNMFSGCTSLTTAPELPATTLVKYCYRRMFEGCTSLATAPDIQATTFGTSADCQYMFAYCTSLQRIPNFATGSPAYMTFGYMFSGCTSLVLQEGDVLPATSFANNYSYAYMFWGCTSITSIPSGFLPATTLRDYSYSYMFANCTSLTSIPSGLLPATTLTNSCYDYMFAGCTSLTTAPELPATTLVKYCYHGMFSGCTNLTTAPELPATTLAENCYHAMFKGCTSLTTAPSLPSVGGAKLCYYSMFSGCSALSAITCLLSQPGVDNKCLGWVEGVSQTGTFTKKAGINWSTGISGIPSGWTVVDAT